MLLARAGGAACPSLTGLSGPQEDRQASNAALPTGIILDAWAGSSKVQRVGGIHVHVH